jgi:hypothetical protein
MTHEGEHRVHLIRGKEVGAAAGWFTNRKTVLVLRDSMLTIQCRLEDELLHPQPVSAIQ